MGFPRDVLVQIVLSRDQAHMAVTGPGLAPPLHGALPISELAGQVRVATPLCICSHPCTSDVHVPMHTRTYLHACVCMHTSAHPWQLSISTHI